MAIQNDKSQNHKGQEKQDQKPKQDQNWQAHQGPKPAQQRPAQFSQVNSNKAKPMDNSQRK